MNSFFRLSSRNILRKPIINLINLLGLSISLALVINLSAYCFREFKTDCFHSNGDRVYLYNNFNIESYTPAVLKEHIDLHVPAVESTVRLATTWKPFVFDTDGKSPIFSDILFADEDFFRLFSYKVLEGDLNSALKEPLSLVITKTLSEKLFGNEFALGRNVRIDNDKELTVTAVIDEPYENSVLNFEAVASNQTRKIVYPNGEEFTNWGWNNFQTFVLLKCGSDPDQTASIISKLFPDDKQESFKETKLLPLKTLYFSDSKIKYVNYLRWGDKRKVTIFLVVALIVLVISLVNFINIFSIQWMNRIRQAGIMRVSGANRVSILLHVLSESIIFFMISLSVAFVLAVISAPLIRNYTGFQVDQRYILSPAFLLISISGTAILSVLLSLFTAFRISSAKVVQSLRGMDKVKLTNSFFKEFLVSIQFTIAIVLIAFTILVQKQVNFGSSSIGLNQKNIVGLKLTSGLSEKKAVLKKLIHDNPNVENTTFTEFFPGNPISHIDRKWQLDGGEKKQLNFDIFAADDSFFRLMGLELVSGRFFSNEITTDFWKIVVNEAFVRNNELINPVGTMIPVLGGNLAEIVGVVRDFHYKEVNLPIEALVISNEPDASYCYANLYSKNFRSLNSTIESLNKAVAGLIPDVPVEICFLDQAVENMYQSELRFRRTFSLFAGCAVFISSLGILAMSMFTSQFRIKEIGVRKVNGAKVSEVLVMLNKDFIRWVGIAIVIAAPVSWYFMHRWLENFAYKTTLSWWIFALAGGVVLVISLLTVSWQSWKAATRNPVEALRYE